ncbi:MAG: S41 family peptidase [Candidatus Obscuribacter sp.]|nr:S41 family peptidase [Candidatus Obscuribacter sp.]
MRNATASSLVFCLVLSTFFAGQSFAIGEIALPLYEQTRQLVEDNYFEVPSLPKPPSSASTDSAQAVHAVETLLASLNNPLNKYLSQPDYQRAVSKQKMRVYGIGISVKRDSDARLLIRQVLRGSSAALAGLEVGDEIIAVDGKSVLGQSETSLSDLIRGPVGSSFKLKFKRENIEHIREVSRGEIVAANLQWRKLSDNVALIKLYRFGLLAFPEFVGALKSLSEPGAIVLDLRDNPGGMIDSWLNIFNALVDTDSKFLSIYMRGQVSARVTAGIPAAWRYTEKPLVVLINKGTAAEAEALAYSLQKSGRAKVVGTHSAGQWYHTELFGLPADTGLQLVTARYINVDGQNLPSSGVQPDLVVEDEGKQEAEALSLLSRL